MNYVKLLTLTAALLSLVPAANADSKYTDWITDNAVYNWCSDKLEWAKKKQSREVIAAEVVVGGLVAGGLYTYCKPVNRAVNALGNGVANGAKAIKKDRRKQVAAAAVVGGAGLAWVLYKYGNPVNWFGTSSANRY